MPICARSDDSVTIPGGMAYAFHDASPDLQLLEVTLPDGVGAVTPA